MVVLRTRAHTHTHTHTHMHCNCTINTIVIPLSPSADLQLTHWSPHQFFSPFLLHPSLLLTGRRRTKAQQLRGEALAWSRSARCYIPAAVHQPPSAPPQWWDPHGADAPETIKPEQMAIFKSVHHTNAESLGMQNKNWNIPLKVRAMATSLPPSNKLHVAILEY